MTDGKREGEGGKERKREGGWKGRREEEVGREREGGRG